MIKSNLKARYGHGKAARSYTWPRKELNAKLFPERAGFFFFTLEFQMATESFLRWQAAIASREVDASPEEFSRSYLHRAEHN